MLPVFYGRDLCGRVQKCIIRQKNCPGGTHMNLEKLYGWMEKRRYNSFLLRLVIGLYLCYLSMQLFRGTVGADASRSLVLILALLFFAIGAALAAISLIAILHGHYIEHVEAEKAEREKKNDAPEE